MFLFALIASTLHIELPPKHAAGRLIFVIASNAVTAPKEQVNDGIDTAQIFAVDVAADVQAVIDEGAVGYPLAKLSDLPAGDYTVQAVLNLYDTFHLGDGRVLSLPPDRGEGQLWNEKPGNLFSQPQNAHLPGELHLRLDQTMPEIKPAADTPYVRHVRFLSERLSKFWGRPVYLGALILLPEGFSTHPKAHYPLVIAHGHFPKDLTGWREKPADVALPAVNLAAIRRECPNGHEGQACKRNGYDRLMQEANYSAYRAWTGPGFPRVLLVEIQHATPYYDDSYAVNSDNVGPYGDAITYDLIPYIEKNFRGLGPWARAMMGGSTGGWETLAAQIFYPTEYNGAYAACPDPVSFERYTTVDLYHDANAYEARGRFQAVSRPAERDYLGRVRSTVASSNQRERALASKGRSGEQWDIWQAVYSPVGDDGYPKPIWDKRTGVIDHSVAEYWRDHFDLDYILARDWQKLAPNLQGKLHVAVGLSDNYYLNDAVYKLEETARALHADIEFAYGARDEHCWSGDTAHSNAESRLTYVQRLVPQMVEHFLKTAPKGADTTSWRY